MASTRRNIPLVLGFSETAQIHDIEPFQVKLGVLYNQGVRVINQSDELLDRYWALP